MVPSTKVARKPKKASTLPLALLSDQMDFA
jgi:hypothetical protein